MTTINKLSKVLTKPAFGYDKTDQETTTFTGGKPFVNDVFVFPKDKEGKPLRFFCQIDLSGVDERVKEHLYLPSSGFLQFYHGVDDLMGMDLETEDFSKNISKILYLEKAFDDESFELPDYGEDLEDGTPLEDSGSERVYYIGEYAELLPFPNSKDNPTFNSDDNDTYSEFYEFVNEKNYELYLGGYPHFTQWDFRKEDNELSLLLGSESGSNILWGDVGAGGFWVTEKNLQKQDYSTSVIFWDCL